MNFDFLEQQGLHKPLGGTPIYGLYRHVLWNRVWVLRLSVLK